MKLAALFLFLVSFAAAAGPYYEHEPEPGPPGPQGIAGLDGSDGKDYLDGTNWSDDEITEMFAAATAMSGLDFDSTTNKTQFGIAIGGYDGEENLAIGIAQVWDSDTVGDTLFSLKTTVKESGHNDKRPWVASAVWKVDFR